MSLLRTELGKLSVTLAESLTGFNLSSDYLRPWILLVVLVVERCTSRKAVVVVRFDVGRNADHRRSGSFL